jgi:hypothetical protein
MDARVREEGVTVGGLRPQEHVEDRGQGQRHVFPAMPLLLPSSLSGEAKATLKSRAIEPVPLWLGKGELVAPHGGIDSRCALQDGREPLL